MASGREGRPQQGWERAIPITQLYLWAIALTGAALVGSFLNVVIHRGPALWGLVERDGQDAPARKGNLAHPRSYCPHCQGPIERRDLVPVVSYLALGGRCRQCRAPIAPRYVLVEIAAIAIAACALALFGFTPAAGLFAVFGWMLLALGVIDLETGYLPDWLTAPLGVIGLLANGAGLFTPLRDAVIGAVAGFAIFWAISEGYRRLRGMEGLGLGDAKLLAALGAWLGWAALPFIVFGAAIFTLLAALISSWWNSQKLDAATPLPLGPGLCLAGFAALAGFAGAFPP